MRRTLKSEKLITSVEKPSGIGPEEVRSDISVSRTPLARLGSSILTLSENSSSKRQQQLRITAISELGSSTSASLNNQLKLFLSKTEPDSKHSFLMLKSSPTLVQGQTPIVPAFPPWCQRFAETKSLKLWLPPKLPSDAFSGTFLFSYARNMDAPSWFKAKEIATASKMLELSSLISLAQSSRVTKGAKEPKSERKEKKPRKKKLNPETTKPPVNGVVKVRAYPSSFQRKMIEKLFRANRYAYNKLVEKTKGKWHTMDPQEIGSLRCLVQKGALDEEIPKLSYCPDECYDSAHREFVKNCQAMRTQTINKALRKALGEKYKLLKPPYGTKLELTKEEKEVIIANLTYPDLKYKKQKDHCTQLEIQKRSLDYDPEKGLGMYKTPFKKLSKLEMEKRSLKCYTKRELSTQKTPNEAISRFVKIKTNLVRAGVAHIPYSVTLCQRQGKYYFIFPRHISAAPVQDRVCALDPGVRTFLSGYDPEGVAFEISPDQDSLYRCKREIEKLQSELEQERNQRRKRNISDTIRSLYYRISNRVNDLHHKASKMLAETYSEILLPKFGTKALIAKENRNIGPDTSYMLQTLSHHKFQTLLEQKMNIRDGKLHICSEEYTSKTCGNCTRINNSLGSNKVFSCPYADCCAYTDRDLNAARNILVMNYRLLGK